VECNEHSTISEPKDEEVLEVDPVLNDEREAKLARYMGIHGITKMNQ
jgi:hypothetical protein